MPHLPSYQVLCVIVLRSLILISLGVTAIVVGNSLTEFVIGLILLSFGFTLGMTCLTKHEQDEGTEANISSATQNTTMYDRKSDNPPKYEELVEPPPPYSELYI